MSLGWRCESALMPKKSKPIDVGSGSMKGLKSLLAQKEEKLTEKNKGNDKELNRRTRPSSSSTQNSKKNVAKEEKVSKSSSRKEEEQERERKREAALLAKAKLYEQIQSGKGVDGLLQSHAATSGGGAFLVNFDEKKKRDMTTSNDMDDHPQQKTARYDEPYTSSSSSSSSSSSNRNNRISDDSVEICDSYGRSRMVPRDSQEHLQYEREQEAIKREMEIQRARDRIFHKGQGSGTEGSGPYIDSRGMLSYPVIADGTRDGGDGTSQQWAWSRGEHHSGTADWLKDIAEQRGIKALVEDRVEKEVGLTQMSEAARVKSQWEKVTMDNTMVKKAGMVLTKQQEEALAQPSLKMFL